jgi:hypothetical protein
MVVEDSMLDFGFDFEGNSIKVNGFLGWDVIQHFCWKLVRINDVIILDRDVFPTDHMEVFSLLASDILMNKVVIIDYPNRKFSLIG